MSITFKVPEDIKAIIQAEADSRGTTLSWLILNSLKNEGVLPEGFNARTKKIEK